MKNFVCIGVPYYLGKKADLPNAVAAVKESGIAAEINAPWVEIQPDFSAAADPVTAVNLSLAKTIGAHPEHFPLIFAGDCMSCVGAVKGLEKLDPAVLWYDAHGDFNTPATTLSNYLGGMPLAALVGRDNQHLMEGMGLAPVDERDVVITDARDLDPEEGVNLRASQIDLLPDVNLLRTHALPPKPLYIHFDTDVVNPDEMPAMSYPAKGGATVDEVIVTLRHVIRNNLMAGILFSLWNDTLPGADLTRQNTLKIVRAVVQELNG